MSRVKSLLKKVEIEVAINKRTCKNTRKIIAPGETCAKIFDGPFRSSCYSREALLKMIERAHKALDELESQVQQSTAE